MFEYKFEYPIQTHTGPFKVQEAHLVEPVKIMMVETPWISMRRSKSKHV